MWRRRMWRQTRGVREQGGVARCGIKTWRQRATYVASKRGVTGSRGVRGPVALPDVASKRGVTCARGVREPGGVARCGVKTWHQGATYVASKRGVTGPRSGRGPVALPDVASKRGARGKCGVTCPKAARWHRWTCTRVHANGLTWRHRMWRQNVASPADVV